MVNSGALARILARERDAILRGDFADLEHVAPLKEALLNKLAETPASPKELRALGVSLAHNQSLLAASIEGIKDVNQRINALKLSSEGFNTYGRHGETSHIGLGKKGFERKA